MTKQRRGKIDGVVVDLRQSIVLEPDEVQFRSDRRLASPCQDVIDVFIFATNECVS